MQASPLRVFIPLHLFVQTSVFIMVVQPWPVRDIPAYPKELWTILRITPHGMSVRKLLLTDLRADRLSRPDVLRRLLVQR